MRCPKSVTPLSLAALLLCLPARASATDTPPTDSAASPATPQPSPESEEAGDAPSLTFDVGVGSAYMWRGANLWGRRTRTQHLSIFPGVTYADGGFSAFYWGAYQLTGKDKGANVDGAVGAEQDLGISYSLSLAKQLSAVPFATVYLWPLATKAATNTTVPAAMEPGVTLAHEGSLVNLGFAVSYYRGLQDYTDAFSHVYLSPTVGKDIELGETWTLNLAASAGYKLWTNSLGADADENDLDVQTNVGFTFSLGDLYAKPALHASWTNISSDALAAWGTLNLGYGLGF